MALFWRIWAAVILVNLAVLTLFVGLATLQFDSISAALVGERLAVLADRTAAPFRAAAKIGLPLSSVRNADALLERARQTDDAILAIHVFDASGRIVHSTDAAPPVTIPLAAGDALSDAAGGSWHSAADGTFLSSVDIPARAGDSALSAGGILIVYPIAGSVTRIRAIGAELALAAIAVMLGAAALSAVLLRFGLGQQIRTFEAIDGAIAEFERGAWRSAAGAYPAAGETGGLRQLLDAAEARYRATGQALTRSGAGTDSGDGAGPA